MTFCSTRRLVNGKFTKKPKRVFSSREEAEPFRIALEKSSGIRAETYRCPKCYELHVGRAPTRVPNTWGSGDWDRLTGLLIKSLRKVLETRE